MLGRLTTRPVAGLELLTGPDLRRGRRPESLPGYKPLEEYALDGIKAERFPPRWAHTGDRSGFDIATFLRLDKGQRLLVSVEGKYTDSFSADSVRWERYAGDLEALGLDQASTIRASRPEGTPGEPGAVALDCSAMSKQGEPQAQEGAVHSIGDWTGQLPDETRATKHHRRAQGLWRSETLGWPAGPPTTKRTRETYPTLPNYLAERHDGQSAEDAGVNLMSEAARTYTRERLPQLEELEGTATRDRLYRNLLSSQPIAFSIAGELRAHPDAAAAVLGRLSTRPVAGLELLTGPDSVVADDQKSLPGYRPLEEYALDGAEAEWFPPRWAHTGDRSGFDIAACLRLDDDRRLLVSVEVKYTDSFSADPVLWDRYAAHLEALGLDQASTDALVQSGCSQVLRQVMITDSVRRLGLAPGAPESGRVDDALAVVLAREDDQRARDVVATLDAAVAMPVQFWSHADFLQAAEQEPALSEWARGMAARYLTTGRDRRSAP